MKIKHRYFGWVAIAVAALALLSRCTPATSHNMRSALLESFLFRAAGFYYPDGPPTDPAQFHPQLTAEQVRIIEDDCRKTLAALSSYERVRGPVLEAYIGRSI